MSEDRMRIMTDVAFSKSLGFRMGYTERHNELRAWLSNNIAEEDGKQWDTARSPNSNNVEIILNPKVQDVAPLIILAWGGKLV